MAVKVDHGTPLFPQIKGEIPPSTYQDLDTALTELHANKDKWVKTGLRERIDLMEQVMQECVATMEEWVDASLNARGLKQGTIAAGDEWASAAVMIHLIRLIRNALLDIEKYGQPQIPGPIKTRADGTVTAQVFPQNIFDKILYAGLVAEVWMQPDVTEATLKSTQAVAYKNKAEFGKVALVLAAGNVSVLPAGDFLHKLFAEDQVVIVKMNPINSYLGPLIERGFKALIDKGVLRVVFGGVEEAQYLIHHELVEELHMTGSDKTFEAIVFGRGAEGEQNKANRTPVMNKPFTSELGSVAPTIVVPGPWTQKDIETQAAEIASMLTNNAGFMCVATRVIINHKDWDHRDALMEAIKGVFAKVDTRSAYYPGAHERYQRFLEAHPEMIEIGDATGDKLPWGIIPDVDPNATDDIVFNTEAFCSLFAETALEANSVAEYIDKAVEFANERLWGNLTATVIIHPSSMKDPAVKAAMQRAEENLRYGSVCINMWGAMSYFIAATTWGGHHGNDKYDPQSGLGYVNNTLMFDKPLKSVLRRPFHQLSRPIVVTSKKYPEFARKYLYFEEKPSWAKLPSILWTALRS